MWAWKPMAGNGRKAHQPILFGKEQWLSGKWLKSSLSYAVSSRGGYRVHQDSEELNAVYDMYSGDNVMIYVVFVRDYAKCS